MTHYPTNVSNSQWQVIKEYLDNERRRKYSIREMLNAMLYVVKTGCQWRMLPQDFPKWQLVYYYYRKWVEAEVFDRILDKLRSRIRLAKGQQARATLGIMDSQSVRWGNNRSFKSYDGNKKIKGIKRHVVVDKNGFLLAVMVTVAHIHDSKAVIMLMRVLADSYHSIKTIIADGGYCGSIIKEVAEKFGYWLQIVLRKERTSNTFKPIHKRWIIERTFSWFDNDRRLCRNYELLMESSEEMVKLSAIKLLLNKI
ncbi:MAG: IS5 family transposase [Chitinophagaceae bacterium]|nr:IS5 family transposase [Chitinophagaceae bacterium]